MREVKIVQCFNMAFNVRFYATALSHLDRYDGMCIKAHPVMAALIAEEIKGQPFRLPVVPDQRNLPGEVQIIDMASTGREVVIFEMLGIPEQSVIIKERA